jgi:hypothetical protein
MAEVNLIPKKFGNHIGIIFLRKPVFLKVFFFGPVESSSDAGGSTTSTIDVGDRRRSSTSTFPASSTFPALLEKFPAMLETSTTL